MPPTRNHLLALFSANTNGKTTTAPFKGEPDLIDLVGFTPSYRNDMNGARMGKTCHAHFHCDALAGIDPKVVRKLEAREYQRIRDSVRGGDL